ncbi:hypothetical protein [Hyphomicrobium sp.]|uniref:hypothetical protein n=1 Tax=Hyphomicrobium sp. TaxID=82 RepID=UPI000FAE6010|nr:hypothetical protein [Hyphomicrobium sp.]RUP08458.1 MAG: hypothetical protein EKK38_14635 [Hyphomicrobium sp.]
MRRSSAAKLVIALLGLTAFQISGFAETPAAKSPIDAVLSRALLERGAMIACAAVDDDADTIKFLKISWERDIAAVKEDLQKAGYDDSAIHMLVDHLDIDKATPRFADRAALTAYCSTLGDWKMRWQLFLVSVPQFELRRVLDK